MHWQGREVGRALPHHIGRHAHPKARPEIDPPPAAATGIDYIATLETSHQARRHDELDLTRLTDNTDAVEGVHLVEQEQGS